MGRCIACCGSTDSALAPLRRATPRGARRGLRESVVLVEGRRRALAEIRDLTWADRPARLYVPRSETSRLLVYFHGGGWVVGDLQTHDRLCQRLADEGQTRVLAVEYRLAPEHPFPAPVLDALALFRLAQERASELGATPHNVGVGGDSAGANLAAVVAMVQRDEGRMPPAVQLLLTPPTDFRRVTPSHRAFEDGYMLTRAWLDWYQGHYAPDIYDVRASPLLASHHRDLAPAIMVTAGFDPLRDDGERYADALRSASVPVVDLHYSGLIHGFPNMDGLIGAADRAMAEVCRALASVES